MPTEEGVWLAIRQRVSQFHSDPNPTPGEVEDALCKALRVGQALERAYCGHRHYGEVRPARLRALRQCDRGRWSLWSPLEIAAGKTTARAIELASPRRDNMASRTERDDARRDMVSG
jgi:hypothetical protein